MPGGRKRQYDVPRRPMQVYLDTSLLDALDTYCMQENQTRPEVVTAALRVYLAQRDHDHEHDQHTEQDR
jgi:metal-responsive CopG/Arc/MetJ family transcriptional regulator